MPVFNGKEMSADAYRIATAIGDAVQMHSLPDGYNIAAIKSDLRRLYVATGGDRGKDGYEPSTAEYRNLFNGLYSGAELLAMGRGQHKSEPKDEPKDEPKAETKAPERQVVKEEKTDAQKLAEILAGAMGGQKVDPEAVKAIAVEAANARAQELVAGMPDMIKEAVAKAVRRVEIRVADMPKVEIKTPHKSLQTVLAFCANRQNVALVGPAGSGKTTIGEQVAEALGVKFYMTGAVMDAFQLKGFIDAQGGYRRTGFREAYEHGGVFLFDEMDGSAAEAIVAFNAPLAGSHGDFPDGMVKRHPDFIAIAAMNTFGRGADRQYVGRQQLDAASLDRFAIVNVDYDEELELAISCDADWTRYVQKVRAAVEKERVRHIVSPRASISGGVMLKAGMKRKEVEEAVIWKGLEQESRNRVLAAMR